MRKNCSRKAYLKRVGAAVLAGTMLLAAMPGTAFAAYAPVTGNPEDTYDAETWAKLQDNVLEYDEIPDLVHVYNSSISEIWKNLRESKEKIDRNIQELDSQRGKMKNLKDEAKDQGNWTGYGNYTMQEIILGKVASGLRSTDLYNRKTVMDAAALSMARDNKQRIRVFGLEGAGNVTQALLGEEIGTMVSTAESTLAE